MKTRHLILAVMAGLLLLCSCARETLNKSVGGPSKGPQVTSISVLGEVVPGGTAVFQANWVGGTGPYTVSWIFTDFVTPAIQTTASQISTSEISINFDQIFESEIANVTVRVTDSQGLFAEHSHTFAQGSHLPQPPKNRLPPQITSATGTSDCSIEIAIESYGHQVEVIAVPVNPEVKLEPGRRLLAGGGQTSFRVIAPNIVEGLNDIAVILTASNAWGSDTAEVEVDCPPATFAADTLYAIPQQSSVRIGEPVRILVLTGKLTTPLVYANGTRVTAPAESGMRYVEDSFNVGELGGAKDEIDGIWLSANPTGFLLAPDFFIFESEAGDGLTGIDFNVTPLDGNATTDSGALFNFEVTFSTEGVYSLGFQEWYEVNRTYYQDHNQADDYFWADISNDHPGIPNSVEVLP